MKKFGFTLGEILIALSVIGVVASLVIPQLVSGQKSAEAKAQFSTAYSLLAKAIADMDSDNVSVDPVSYYTKSQSFYEKMREYNRLVIDCGPYSNTTKNTSVCITRNSGSTGAEETDNYYIYNKKSNTKIDMSLLDDGAFVINNGMLFAFENNGSGVNPIILVTVDINGKNKLPNRWGWDLFTFEFVKGDILPLGAPGTNATYSTNPKTFCDKNSTNTRNGITCGYYAATNEDYFKELYTGH